MIFYNNKYIENGYSIKKIKQHNYSYLIISQDSTAIIKPLTKKEEMKERNKEIQSIYQI